MQHLGIMSVILACWGASGCWDETIIGTENLVEIPTGDTDIDTDKDTDTDTDSDTGTDTDTDTGTGMDSDTGSGVPTDFSWNSSELLIVTASDTTGIKDPSVVMYQGQWLVYATGVFEDGLGLTYLSFTDWDQAGAAEQIPLSNNPNLAGYKAAPQLFYFAPGDLWYLVYQSQEPSYSTSTNPTDVNSWSEMKLFMPMPLLLADNDLQGYDYWVICDDVDCYLFFSANNDVLYRARTAKTDFPNGFEGSTEIVVQKSDDPALLLFNACNVYKMARTDQYLLIGLSFGDTGPYFRAWKTDRLDGDWVLLADTEANPFASLMNVSGADWSWGISHGEMLRSNPDETMTIDTGSMQYLFSGLLDDDNTNNDNSWGLALLTDAR